MGHALKFDAVFSGRTSNGYYLTDDRDCLPPDLLSFDEGSLDTGTEDLMASVHKVEDDGTYVCIQLGDFYYETEGYQ